MQKIYVLLRNEKQTGPYTLEEVIQFNLKPHDLIWIEGKSAGWYYPQEIGALHPYLDFLPKKPTPAATKATRQSSTVTPMAEPPKAVAPTIAALTTAPADAPGRQWLPPETAGNLEQAVYAQFTPPAKEIYDGTTSSSPTAVPARKAVSTLAVAALATVIVGGIFAMSWMMNRHPADNEPMAETGTAVPVAEVSPTVAASNNDKSKVAMAVAKPAKNRRVAATKTTVTSPHRAVAGQVAKRSAASMPAETAGRRGSEGTASGPAEATPPPAEGEKNIPAQTSAPTEKKKKLRDKILDIFRSKPEATGNGDPAPADSDNGRQATHRGQAANLAQMVSIRFVVPNDWMMGIKGAKAILVNRGGEKISKAVIEILYYNDDNELLQKRQVSFGKVGGKDSQTVSIPDHPTATKVDYSIVSVSGDPAA